MTRQLFLFGDQADNFAETSQPFIEAAGGSEASVAVLSSGGGDWRQHIARITNSWQEVGAEIIAIAPDEVTHTLDTTTIAMLNNCTGVMMLGGDPRTYHSLYVASPLGQVIRKLYAAGIPYTGVSAGAAVVSHDCAVWGGIVTTPDNEYNVRAATVYGKMPKEEIQLTLAKGLGLLPNCMIEAHFSEYGGFSRLATVLDMTETHTGLGLDEPICLAIEDERVVNVSGRGRAYHLRRTGPRQFAVQVYEPGESFVLAKQ